MRTVKEDVTASCDRKKWATLFGALVHMLQNQQSQLETLVGERERLGDRIRVQYDRWVSDVRLFDDQISQMKREMALAELARSVELAKADLVRDFKDREAFLYKLKLEHMEDELTDFKAWFDFRSHRCQDQKYISPHKMYETSKDKETDGSPSRIVNSKKAECHYETLEDEVKRLKFEYDKLSVKHNHEVSALLSEKDFVWNHYRNMEGEYVDQLRMKNEEVDRLNEDIVKLLASMEELQSTNMEKKGKIACVEANVAKLEAETKMKNEEISRLSKEVELSRGLKSSHPFTPLLNPCMIEPKASRLEGNGGSQNERSTNVKKESSSSMQRIRIIKRKQLNQKLQSCSHHLLKFQN
ncbi:hypothetical protein Nepgr_025636 [Nepenthes gracilis]|uniref:Uncharacterized protein n=1 Tax=Nepenthes gracilis TaxID=150966 RepID=A0AAD3T5A5_NEPGR|nr:hypothetical protein Nepgr_025636 [Nepenthes gracilis]